MSWSKSRAGTLAECPRQYFFNYYGSWEGWLEDADERTRAIYVLKQLRNRPVWAGEIVHAAVERVLATLRATRMLPPLQEVLEQTRENMREAFRSSRSANYWQQPKTAALFEHEYQTPVTGAEWRATAEHVDACLRWFYGSDIFRKVQDLAPEAWLELEELSGFQVDGCQVHVKLDLSYRENEGVVLVDWKTGRRDSRNRDQVALYALFAVAKWDADPQRVRGAPVYLMQGAGFDPQPVTVEDSERVSALMRESISRMRVRLHDAEANVARREDYEPYPGRVCRTCPFREACPEAR